MTAKLYKWAAPGDVNAFFGLMLDNVADLLLAVSLLHLAFEFPTEFALRYMVPGTAIGVFVGDILFFAMAFKLAARTGRKTVTAMPLGLDTPSTFGMVFFVLGPAFVHATTTLNLDRTAAALYTWHIGICSIFVSGLFKFACALGSGWIRRVIPRAGLLGSLAAIALVIISFLPLLEILQHPLVGFVALAVILTTLVGRVPLPGKIPGALGGLLVAGTLYYLMQWSDQTYGTALLGGAHGEASIDPQAALLPYEWMSVWRFEWLHVFKDSLHYLPIVLPLALGTVVGGIDCTESAAAVGDEYFTERVIGVEALATLVAALCGGVIQTTPYIGHPAYKAMGGRAAYTLATALFIGSAGVLGYFGYLYLLIPKATVFPILIFVGLEITAQSFLATPKRHYAAVAFSCVPALAALALIFVDKLFGDPALFTKGISIATLQNESLRFELGTVRMLASGFIVTSLLWASLLASVIDRRLFRAAAFSGVAGACALFGVIHSPLPGSPIFIPWKIMEWKKLPDPGIWRLATEGDVANIYQFAGGYLAVAVLMVAWGFYLRALKLKPLTRDEEYHQ